MNRVMSADEARSGCWLSTIEVSEMLDLSPRHVCDLVALGDLAGERFGRTVLVRRESAEAFAHRGSEA